MEYNFPTDRQHVDLARDYERECHTEAAYQADLAETGGTPEEIEDTPPHDYLACPRCQSKDVEVMSARAYCNRCDFTSADIPGDWLVKVKLVPAAQGVLLPELEKKPAVMQISPIYRDEVA